MAFSLQRSFVSLKYPNCISRSHLRGASAPVCLRRLNLAQLQLATCRRSIHVDRRGVSRLISFAASHDDSQPVNDVEKKNESDIKIDNSQEAWKESLDYFKSEAIKLKAMSEEAYEVYSKKASEVLLTLSEKLQIEAKKDISKIAKEISEEWQEHLTRVSDQVYSKKASEVLLTLSEKLQIEAKKAQKDISKIAKEISEEGQEYLTRVSENPPESTKELVGVFRESSEVKNIDDVRDYHVGVVYGSYLAIGGSLSFMLTGSIAAVRFGIILGGALVALAICSKRSYNSGHGSLLLFQGQTAIATVIFLRELMVFRQGCVLVSLIRMLISAAAAGFFVYRMFKRGEQSKIPTSQPISED